MKRAVFAIKWILSTIRGDFRAYLPIDAVLVQLKSSLGCLQRVLRRYSSSPEGFYTLYGEKLT